MYVVPAAGVPLEVKIGAVEDNVVWSINVLAPVPPTIRPCLKLIPVEYNTAAMDYSVGSRVRFKLYGGKIVEAKITAIVNQSGGRKIRISFGKESVAINPEQIIEVLPSQ